jgi:hypothetical protein
MNRRRTLLTVLLVFVVSTIAIPVQAMAGDEKDSLTGTWTVKVTPPVALGDPFSSIMTFTEDGNLIETANGGSPPALGNPGLGVWGKQGDHLFAWTFLFYDYDISLQLIDTGKVRGKIKLDKDGNKFTGKVEVTIYNLDGSVQFSGPGGTVEGKRVKLEPLP